MSTSTITEQRCQVCGEVVERRYPGRWGVYHRVRPARDCAWDTASLCKRGGDSMIPVRPRVLRRRLWSLVVLAVLILTGLVVSPKAGAAPNICVALDRDPRVGTVVSLVGALVADGWSPYESGGIIAEVVLRGCPEHEPVLQRFIDEFAPRPVQVPDKRFVA